MKKIRTYIVFMGCFMYSLMINAQSYCSNPLDSVYGLTTDGGFHSINVNNAGTSALLGGANVTHAINSNGLGYSTLTNKFYFINRCANSDSIEFASYDPITKAKVLLAKPPAPMNTTTDKIRSATVDNDGVGYYTILTNKPTNFATLYYYNIPTNTWKIIAQSFKDTLTGNSLDSQFCKLNSGDMTFDGSGNLWIICSKAPKYALYEVPAPVTAVAVPKLAVNIIIPTRDMPRAASVASFTGIAFNSHGSLYLTTGSNSAQAVGLDLGAGNDYNLLYKMSAISPVTIDSVGRLPNSYGDDLTSCSYPQGVLPLTWLNFSAQYVGTHVQLNWAASEAAGTLTGYFVQRSKNGTNWQNITTVPATNTPAAAYTYVDEVPPEGILYYRIVQVATNGKQLYSATKVVNSSYKGRIVIGPNPVSNELYFYGREKQVKLFAQVYNTSGQLMLSKIINPDIDGISVAELTRGVYTIKLFTADTMGQPFSYQFVKQ